MVWLMLGLACKGEAPSETGDDTQVSADDTADQVDPDTVGLDGTCALEDDYGGFVVEVYEDLSNVEGAVSDGVVPESVLENILEDNGCVLWRQNLAYCDGGCDAGYVCDFEGNCLPYPSNQDLGTVSIGGLGTDVAMEPVTPGYTYYDTSLAHPAFTGGELIALRMPAGTYGPVTLHGVGVEPLAGLGDGWFVEDGVDTIITWDPPTASVVRSDIVVKVRIDLHGSTPLTLACTWEDTGSGTIPGKVMAQMVAGGVTGFPQGFIWRRTADKAEVGEGCMDLVVSSPREVEVDVANFTPCLTDEDCPKGQECDVEFQICVDQ